MSCMVRLGLAAVLTAATGMGRAQGTPARPGATGPQGRHGDAAVLDRYPSEPVVVERLDTVYRYLADGTGTKVDTEAVRVQNEAGVRTMSVVSVPYSAGRERVEVVYLRVRKRNGAVVETPGSDAQDQETPVTRVDPQYSDSHLLRIGVRGLAVGDRLELQVRTVFTAAQAKNEFWGFETLGRGRVTMERGVELHVPVSRNVMVDSPEHPAQASEEGAEKVYRWTGSQLTPTVHRAGAPEESAGGQAEEGRPAIAWTTFPNWAAVADWYRGLTLPNTAPAPAVKAKADEVVYRLKTQDAKIQALYAFVSSSVRSIDAPLGRGHYGAQPAEQVLANLYGDSQDKSALLVAMLRAEGIGASTALAGSGLEVDEAVPTPAWFDRAITLAHDAEHGDVWLDTTPEVAPYRMLERPMRNRLALVIPPEGQPVLRRTPADAPFPEFTRYEAVGTLSGTGDLTAHVEVSLRGGEELVYREALRNLGPAQWDRLAGYYAQRNGLPGQPSNTTADVAAKTDAPMHMSFDWAREGYADWENFRFVPSLPALDLPFMERKTAPKTEIELSKRTDTAAVRVTLPEGFGVDLPAAVHATAPFATLGTTYRLEKSGSTQTLVVERTLQVTVDQLPASDWPAYRAFLDEAAKSNPVLQLTSTVAHTGPGHFAPAAGENNPQAAALVDEANEAAAAKDYTAATAKLDQAKALFPRQPLLWSSYGAVAQATGKPEEASADLRRELKEHPEEVQVSHRLAGLLVQQGKNDEAVTVLRSALEADPQDATGARFLAELLGKTDLAAAESTLRAGMAASPENLALQLALGEVLLREGKRDEAVKLISAVAVNSADAAQLNDAAYALAGAEANLRVAEGAARRALQSLNAAAARGVNGVGSTADLRRSAELVGTWDTYGWVLFQEGSYSEAEPWLRAAWADSPGGATGVHWAKLLQRQGKSAEAGRVLAPAARGERSGDDGEEGSLAGLGDAAPRARAGGKAGVKTVGLTGGRTVPVPRGVAGASGTAMFELDYSLRGGTVARFVRGDEALEGMADALAQAETGTVIPPGSVGHLLRRGVLTCGAGPTCSLRLLSVRDAVLQSASTAD